MPGILALVLWQPTFCICLWFILWSFGCFVLTYTGIENLLTIKKVELDLKFKKTTRLRHSILSGFIMALLNPLTILFWLGIYGSILAGSSETLTGYQVIIYSMAILVGIIIVDITMAIISSGARKYLTSTLLKTISILSSIAMIGFGIYFGIQAFHALFK